LADTHAVDHRVPQHTLVGGGVAGFVEKAEVLFRNDARGEVARAAEVLEAFRIGHGPRAWRRLEPCERRRLRCDRERYESDMGDTGIAKVGPSAANTVPVHEKCRW
jgi:hypothetical protein